MIDTHAHLLSKYYKEDFDSVLEESLSSLDYIFNIAYSINSSKEVVELANEYSKIKAVVGVHPNDIEELSENFIEELKEIINDEVIAIGEVGLDYHYEPYDKNKQQEVFIKFIELARELKLPVVVHSREANEDTIKIIKNYKDVNFLFHS
jgi:TatD DNase family protein